MHEGYFYITGGMANDGWLQFSGIGIADGGYVAQEVKNMAKKN